MDTFESSNLNLQLLEKQFYLVTKQYEEARMQYIQSLTDTPLQTKGKYRMIGLGFYGRLYSKETMTSYWKRIDDNTNDFKSICTDADGKGILGVDSSGLVYIKSSYKDSTWNALGGNSCCVIDIAMAQNGTLLGVGTDNKLYRKNTVYDNWERVDNPNQGSEEMITAIAVSPSGVVYAIGMENDVWKKESYINTENQLWQFIGTIQDIVHLSFTPDDIFVISKKDGNVYTNSEYKTNFLGGFISVSDSCCIKQVTFTFVDYSDLDSQKYSLIQGSTFWGTGELTTVDTVSLEDCEALCSADEKCTGATYNPSDHDGISYCWTRTGEGSLGSGLENDYAIINPMKLNTQHIIELDIQLNSLSQQIQQEMNKMTPVINNEIFQKDADKDKLQQMYSALQEQRQEIASHLSDLHTMQLKYDDTSSYLHQKNLAYIFLIFIVFIFFVIFITMWMTQSFPQSPPSLFNSL